MSPFVIVGTLLAVTFQNVRIQNGTLVNEGPEFHKDAQIVASITRNENVFPLYLSGRKGCYLPCFILSREEALVYVLAHELRHAWQTNHKRARIWGSRGLYSERDADSYAIRVVRSWRRQYQTIEQNLACLRFSHLFSSQYEKDG